MLDDLKTYHHDLESAPHYRSYCNNSEFRHIMKEMDGQESKFESQITKLRHLLLLQQQYLSLVNEITNFVNRYTEVIKEVENSASTTEEKIKRYDDVISRIQECEASLSTAEDKGDQIAEEGTVQDRNVVTEKIQNFKQQLQGLRREVENKKAEHELTATEHKNYAMEMDNAISWLHEKETVIRSRPLLERNALSIDIEIRRHEVHCTLHTYLYRPIKILTAVRSLLLKLLKSSM